MLIDISYGGQGRGRQKLVTNNFLIKTTTQVIFVNKCLHFLFQIAFDVTPGYW